MNNSEVFKLCREITLWRALILGEPDYAENVRTAEGPFWCPDSIEDCPRRKEMLGYTPEQIKERRETYQKQFEETSLYRQMGLDPFENVGETVDDLLLKSFGGSDDF